jgi:endonuclease/exonuclease/phosphatase (EEP) superfamily protein YafD
MIQKLKRFLLVPLAVVLSIVSLAAPLGVFHWLGDTLAMPIDYYTWILLGLLGVFGALRAWRWAIFVGVVVLINGWTLTNYVGVAAAPQANTPRDLRVVVYNMYHLNQDLNAAIAEARRYDADLIFLMEYSDAINQQVTAAFADYPYQLIRPSRFTMGLALFSRIPFDDAQVHRFEATRIPIYQVQVQVAGQPISFVGGHPWPPQPQWGELHRNQMLEITRIAANAPKPLIVAGDFNAAPWSHVMRNLATEAGVRQVRETFDLRKTWFGLPLISLPLDHVLVSDEWQVLNFQYGAASGSDHLPIVIDLRLR